MQEIDAGKPERISKILSRAGVASRRDVERMIAEGRVRLNGAVLETPVVNATLSDVIEVDGMPIRGIERTRLWLYHKPAGLVTTNADPEGRPTVFDRLPADLPRVLSIGRLDINTEGLLLLTNDGGLSRVLELPSTGWLRRYRVRAHGAVDQAALDRLKEGIAVDGVLYGAIDATLDRSQGHNVWITVALREGKNREIKNVFGALGLEVNRLIRISYGPFQLGDLAEGSVVEVHGRMLRDQLGPRLIEAAKANFDAPIYRDAGPGQAAPEQAENEDAAPQPRRPRSAAKIAENPRPMAETGEKPRTGARARPQAAGSPARGERKLSDRPPRDKGERGERGERGDRSGRGGFKGAARDTGEERRDSTVRARGSNVWMAPGARPVRDGVAKKSSARADAERLFKKPAPENDRPVTVRRAEEDSDWIRAETPARVDREGEGDAPRRRFSARREEGGQRDFADRPPREPGQRPRAARPAGSRSPAKAGGKPPSGSAERSGSGPHKGGGKPGGKAGTGRSGGSGSRKPRS